MDEDEVERRLRTALGTGLRASEVDVVALVQGARAGAHRVRRRRRAVAGAALALAVTVPVGGAGLWTWQERAEDPVRSAAGLPDPGSSLRLTPDPSPGQLSEPAVPPAPVVDPATLAPDENAVEIPFEVLLADDDLPVPMERLDMAAYRSTPVVMGQQCNLGRGGTEPVAGVGDRWAEENSNRLDQLSVSTNVTAYSREQGEAAYDEALTDTGVCRWDGPGAITELTTEPGRQGFTRAATAEGDGAGQAQTVLVVGDLLVGVQVRGQAEEVDEAAVSLELAELVAERLVEERVPGSAG